MAGKKATPSTEVANYDDEMAKRAKRATKAVSNIALGSFIQTRGGQLSYNGSPVPGNALDVVILGYVRENKYYGARYDPDSPTSPICYAFAAPIEDEDEEAEQMAPMKEAPVPQNDVCEGCELNEFESSDTGRGKACKNTARIAVIPADAADDPLNAQVAYISPPVTSMKGFAGYIKALASNGLAPLGVVTTIKLVPDPKSQFKMLFSAGDDVPKENWPDLFKASDKAMADIIFPYPVAAEREEAAPSKARGKVAPQRAAGKAVVPAKAATGRRGR